MCSSRTAGQNRCHDLADTPFTRIRASRVHCTRVLPGWLYEGTRTCGRKCKAGGLRRPSIAQLTMHHQSELVDGKKGECTRR